MSIIECVASNVLFAALLAVVAIIAERTITKPQITHVLWVLVLVKLITPPVVQIPVRYTVADRFVAQSSSDSNSTVPAEQPLKTYRESREHSARVETGLLDVVVKQGPEMSPARGDGADGDLATAGQFITAVPWGKVFLSGWATGSLIWFLLAVTRLMRFRKVLRLARVAPDDIQEQVRSIASRYGLRGYPRVLVADAKVPPLMWSLGRRATMVLPSELLSRLGPTERAALLAHELAHLRRYDHWIRWLEFLVLGLYWWNPLAWWARSHVQQADEECCDAWVLWVYPDSARKYAQTLVDTVEYLADSPEATPGVVTMFSQGDSLRRRIEMIVSRQPFRASLQCR